MNNQARPVWAKINLNHAAHNVAAFKQLIGKDCHLLAVVKANAYGHGDLEIARVALANGASWLAVALPEEGLRLRRAGIAAPILVLGVVSPQQLEMCVSKDLVLSVFQWDIAQALSNIARRLQKIVRIHVKIDTGMNRVGIPPEETVNFIKRLKGLPGIEIQGILTHFATAERNHDQYTLLQWQKFNWVLLELKKQNINIPIKHCANTAATLQMPATHLDMVRVGLGIYGLYPCSHPMELRPVLGLHTEVAAVKRVPKGSAISYGNHYVTWKDTTIVTLPVGYADGLSRRLSGSGVVLINGEKYKYAGNITMDQCMVDVGDALVRVGDKVTLIGFQGDATISVDDWAEWMDTISYEVTCMISNRVNRIY